MRSRFYDTHVYKRSSPISQRFSPSGEQLEQHELAHTLQQLTVVEQYFTNIAAIQNMGL